MLFQPIPLLNLLDYHEYISDNETLQFKFFPTKTLKESKESLVSWNIAHPLGKYALILKENYKMVGHISLTLNEENNSGIVGYTLNKHYWNKGYVTEALQQVVNLGFEIIELTEIEASFVSENVGSQRVLEKNGFTFLNANEKRTSLRGETVYYTDAKLTNKKLYHS